MESLGEDLRFEILKRVSETTGGFRHGLVCRDWFELGRESLASACARERCDWLAPGADVPLDAGEQVARELGQFPALRCLKLQKFSAPRLCGPLPSDPPCSANPEQRQSGTLGSFSALTELHLENPKEFPGVLEGLTSLRVLKVHALTRALPPSGIAHMTGLTCLTLDMPHLWSLPEEIGALVSLKNITINSPSLSSLPSSLGSLSKLMSLSLDTERLSFLPASMGSLVSLKRLNICSNKLTTFPASFSALLALRHVRLACDTFEGPLPPSMGSLSDLRSLELLYTNVAALPAGILQLTSLTRLQVGDCLKSLGNHRAPVGPTQDSGDEPKGPLAPLTQSYSSDRPQLAGGSSSSGSRLVQGLNTASLSDEPRTGGACIMPSLRKLRLEWFLLDRLPPVLGSLRALEELYIVSGLQMEQLPGEIGELSGLRVLFIDHCNKLMSLPSAVSGLASLETLVVARCRRIFCLPEQMGQLSSLRRLKLEDLSALRKIPESLGNLVKVETVVLKKLPELQAVPARFKDAAFQGGMLIEECPRLSQ